MTPPNQSSRRILLGLATATLVCMGCDADPMMDFESTDERDLVTETVPADEGPDDRLTAGPGGSFLYTGDFAADSGLAVGIERWSVYLHPEDLTWVVIGRQGDEAVANLTIATNGEDLDMHMKYPFEVRRQVVDGVVLEDSLGEHPDAYELVYAMGADISLGGQDVEPVNGKCYAAGGVGAGSCILGAAACAGVITCGAGAAVCLGGAWLALCECNPGQIVCQ